MTRKGDLYALVGELRSYGWTPGEIAKRLGQSKRRVQQVIAELRAPAMPWSDLPALLRERIEHYAKRNDS